MKVMHIHLRHSSIRHSSTGGFGIREIFPHVTYLDYRGSSTPFTVYSMDQTISENLH
jgi:hypothetical protein